MYLGGEAMTTQATLFQRTTKLTFSAATAGLTASEAHGRSSWWSRC